MTNSCCIEYLLFNKKLWTWLQRFLHIGVGKVVDIAISANNICNEGWRYNQQLALKYITLCELPYPTGQKYEKLLIQPMKEIVNCIADTHTQKGKIILKLSFDWTCHSVYLVISQWKTLIESFGPQWVNLKSG